MKIFLDRIDMDENGLPVATFDVEDKMVSFKSNQMPVGFAEVLIPNAIVECEIDNGFIVNPVILYEETKQKEEKMRNRLHSLFKRESDEN